MSDKIMTAREWIRKESTSANPFISVEEMEQYAEHYHKEMLKQQRDTDVPLSKWISVEESDKLPWKKGLVLLLVNGMDVYVGTLRQGQFEVWGSARPDPITDMKVTHWQPLPYVPEEYWNQGDKDERSVATGASSEGIASVSKEDIKEGDLYKGFM